MSGRFVIQIHSDWGPTHYDLMLPGGAALATWQLDRPPLHLPAGGLPARRLADHRLEYLTYEGPISGQRGNVRILDAGECDVAQAGPERWRFHLAGRLLAGWFELRLIDPAEGRWLLSAGEGP